MKTETQKITITIEKREALSIYNALLKANDQIGQVTAETKGAQDLQQILQANFFIQITGVHTG